MYREVISIFPRVHTYELMPQREYVTSWNIRNNGRCEFYQGKKSVCGIEI